MIAVSACLVGENVKYNGGNNKNEAVIKYLEGKDYIKICPEVFGLLPIPRTVSEIVNGKVINKDGIDVTDNFIKGAKESLEFIKKYHVTEVILKSNSPSCGKDFIYDGTFTGTLVPGNGIFVTMLLKENIKILTEKEIEEL